MRTADLIVYLHGFASGPGSRKAQYFRDRFLEVGTKLEIPDLAGGDFENLTITGQLDILGRLVAGRRAILVGSSLGGYLAALYAARHPEAQRLVLLAPAFSFPTRWPESLGRERMAEWERTGTTTVFHYGDRRERPLSYRLIEDGRNYEDFPNVTQPALVFHGRHDTVVPPAASEYFAAFHPNVRLEVLDSDHELGDVLAHLWERIHPFVLGA